VPGVQTSPLRQQPDGHVVESHALDGGLVLEQALAVHVWPEVVQS